MHHVFQGIDVGGTDFDRRLLCIQREIIGPRHTKMQQGLLDKTKEPFSVRAKQFWDIQIARKVSEHFVRKIFLSFLFLYVQTCNFVFVFGNNSYRLGVQYLNLRN